MHKPRYFSTWNMSVVSAKHFPGNPWGVPNCEEAHGKHGVNIPYHTPSTSRKTAKTSVTFIMSIIFYRCIGLTADSIINHRNLAKVCTNVHGSFPIARTILYNTKARSWPTMSTTTIVSCLTSLHRHFLDMSRHSIRVKTTSHTASPLPDLKPTSCLVISSDPKPKNDSIIFNLKSILVFLNAV